MTYSNFNEQKLHLIENYRYKSILRHWQRIKWSISKKKKTIHDRIWKITQFDPDIVYVEPRSPQIMNVLKRKTICHFTLRKGRAVVVTWIMQTVPALVSKIHLHSDQL